MDLGPTQKPRIHLGGLSTKQVAFLGVAVLVLVGGIILRNVNSSDEPAGEETAPVAGSTSPPKAATPQTAAPKVATPEVVMPETATAPTVPTTAEPVPETPPAAQEAATAPSEPVAQAGDAVQQAEPPLPDESMILVARRPVELLAGPSASATVMYGFPAGRPFRVIGEEGGFVQIRDEQSGASGWIDKTALAAPPPVAPVVTTRSRPKPAGGGRRSSKPSPKPEPDTSIADELERSVEPPRRPGLFGGDGLFGGLFRN